MSKSKRRGRIAAQKKNQHTETSSDPADVIAAADVAEDAARAILEALLEEGIADPDGVRDLLHDYRGMAEQLRAMTRKYITPTEAPIAETRRGTELLCPECGYVLIGPVNHCGQCGKRVLTTRERRRK